MIIDYNIIKHIGYNFDNISHEYIIEIIDDEFGSIEVASMISSKRLLFTHVAWAAVAAVTIKIYSEKKLPVDVNLAKLIIIIRNKFPWWKASDIIDHINKYEIDFKEYCDDVKKLLVLI